jgi:hypothetical protein
MRKHYRMEIVTDDGKPTVRLATSQCKVTLGHAGRQVEITLGVSDFGIRTLGITPIHLGRRGATSTIPFVDLSRTAQHGYDSTLRLSFSHIEQLFDGAAPETEEQP